MRLKVVGTGSSGNAYILQAKDGAALLIECGVRFREIKAALDYDITNVVGCLVTHEHGDHASSVGDLAYAGIDIFMSAGTKKALNLGPSFTAVEPLKMFSVGPFTCMAFKVKHNAADPVAFMIHHPESGNVLFATDTYYLRYKFPNLNNIIIEANYCEKIVERQETTSNYLSHMSIQTCLKTLAANDLTKVNNIVLIHLSNGNSHARDFKQQVERSTNKTVFVADNGLEIDLNKTPF